MQPSRNNPRWEAAAALGALFAILFCFAMMAHAQPCYLYEWGKDQHGKTALIPIKLAPNEHWDRFCNRYRLVQGKGRTYIEVFQADGKWERKEFIDCSPSRTYYDRDGRFYFEARSVAARWPCPYVPDSKVAAEHPIVK